MSPTQKDIIHLIALPQATEVRWYPSLLRRFSAKDRAALSAAARLRTFGVDADRLTVAGVDPFDGLLLLCDVGVVIRGDLLYSMAIVPRSSLVGEGTISEIYSGLGRGSSSEAIIKGSSRLTVPLHQVCIGQSPG